MNERTFCGHVLNSLHNTLRPFEVVFVLDYYDGPVSGAIRCQAHCPTSYKFELLDWDKNHFVRIYGLSPLESGDLEELLALAINSPPEKLDAAKIEAGYIHANQIMARASQMIFIMAWDLSSDRIISIKEGLIKDEKISPPLFDNAQPIQEIDWFKFLNLSK